MKVKTLIFTLFACSFSLALFAQNNLEPVNGIFGDSSFYWKFGRFPGPEDGDFERVTAHLEYAEFRLRKATPDDMSPALAQKRFEMLDHLTDYYLRGSFPANFDRTNRKPCFIDAEDRICAVGYLVEQTKGRDLAEQINEEFQYAVIEEMDTDFLGAWAKEYGLSVQDLAMIQPAYGPSVQYPRYTGNDKRDLQIWVDSTLTYPAGLTEKTTLEIYFVVSEFGNPQWPVTIEGDAPKEFIKSLRKQILKMKFSPYTYNGTKGEFKYSMSLTLVPEGEVWDDGTYAIISTDSLNLSPAAPAKDKITIQGRIERNNLTYKWGSNAETHHEPIIGATIKIAGTQAGTYADVDGNFQLTFDSDLVGETFEVQVASLGYKPVAIREVPKNDQTITIRMQEEIITLYMHGYPPFEAPSLHLVQGNSQ